jgi:hypothetical protein
MLCIIISDDLTEHNIWDRTLAARESCADSEFHGLGSTSYEQSVSYEL